MVHEKDKMELLWYYRSCTRGSFWVWRNASAMLVVMTATLVVIAATLVVITRRLLVKIRRLLVKIRRLLVKIPTLGIFVQPKVVLGAGSVVS